MHISAGFFIEYFFLLAMWLTIGNVAVYWQCGCSIGNVTSIGNVADLLAMWLNSIGNVAELYWQCG
jgi:hypothetical protein